jgi:hypothetical protein
LEEFSYDKKILKVCVCVCVCESERERENFFNR